MIMFNLSNNYYHRKCFLEREQVPTQTVMKKFMRLPLATVYFNSMIPSIRVLAGFEPVMKGGGKDWFVPPKELLAGRAVMKPFNKECMKQWNCYGVDKISMVLLEEYHLKMREEYERKLCESDIEWQQRLIEFSHETWHSCSVTVAHANTSYLRNAFSEFTTLYTGSVNKLQTLLFDGAVNTIKSYREENFQKMQSRYEYFLKEQSIMLTERYDKKLNDEKERLKANFILDVETARAKFGQIMHDINLERHVAVEKLRNYLECQNLACQIYVALKERQECLAEMESKKYEHAKRTRTLNKDNELKDFEIYLAEDKEMKQQTLNTIWKKKVCHAVKTFQLFVTYSLKLVPDQADFFINMETLMLLQLSDALHKPKADSIIEMDVEQFHTPIPRPLPFYLFCDRGTKAKVLRELCPKHCTSSASQFPVIVINKRCIYAACDNFEQFSDRIKNYIHGEIINESDFEDKTDYARTVPVQYTPSQQVRELALESSLLQVLQREITNMRRVNVLCSGCHIAHCFDCYKLDSPIHTPKAPSKIEIVKEPSPVPSIPSGNKISTREEELFHQREPKWGSYVNFIQTKKCDCSKIAKKHLFEHLPAYMTNMSHYEAPVLPHYETCSVETIKYLVKKAKGKKPLPPLPPKVPSKTREISTQYSDLEFEYLCTCFSEDSLMKFINTLPKEIHEAHPIQHLSVSEPFLTKERLDFVKERAFSLIKLIEKSSEVKEIFKKSDCKFD